MTRSVLLLAVMAATLAAAAPAGAKIVTFSGQAITNADPTQTGRLSQNGVVSTCEAPKSTPGLASGSDFHYDEHAVTNDGPGISCVHVTVTGGSCGVNSGAHSVAYQPGMNPSAVASGYLGDHGASVDAGNASDTYSVNAAPGGLGIVVHGLGTTGLCASYDVTARVAPSAATDPAANIGKTSASLLGSVNEESEESTVHFEYGTTTAYGTSTTPAGLIGAANNANKSLQPAVGGLTPNTTYHYRTVIEYPANGAFPAGTAVGQDQTFRTTTDPTATTAAATAVTAGGATLNGQVNPGGVSTTYKFEYGPTASYGTSTSTTSAGSDFNNHAVSEPITGLEPGTTHHFRVVATQQGGATINGSDTTFTTPPLPPTATTGDATNLAAGGATLNGTIDPGGGATTFHFDFGKTTDYGSSTDSQSAGSDHTSHALAAALSGLEPGTAYHFRIVAEQGQTVVNGADSTFTTPPLAPVCETLAATGVTTSGATLSGSVDPGGGETTFTFEFGTTDAYGSSTAAQSAGADHTVHAVSVAVVGLAPATLHHFRITVRQGSTTVNCADATFTTQALPPPAGGGGGTTPASADVIAPAFTAGPRAAPSRVTARRGTTLTFTLTEAARVTFTFERVLSGRRIGTACRAPNAGNRRRRACKRFVKVKGSLSSAGALGANTVRFTGRVGGRLLARGSYRVTVIAIDAAGNRSASKRLTLTVAR